MTCSCLFAGKVVHIRHQPVAHRLAYRIFMGLFDLDELAQLARRLPVFGYNSPGLFSFQDRDHGDGSGAPLRPQVEHALASAGIEPRDGPIRILCMPRVLGYVFNPLSVYFCYDAQEHLYAAVHEVNNTFGERHFYALPAHADSDGLVRQACAKAFRVSPLLEMELDYRFTIAPPADSTSVHIAVDRNGAGVLSAWFAGRRRPLSNASLMAQLLVYPAMTWKVIAGIHWEALVTWLKLRSAARSANSI